ncbi:porin OmpC [Citrobacter sp. A316]|uniref:porin OmpC n=1 Tax=Citrobacter sp. A316 TaxID=1639132 RepID=UPI0009AC319E|nr:porin OmpC [Citrobacter sp. A316]OPW95979.1 porin [Citrobacter sp. A316]
MKKITVALSAITTAMIMAGSVQAAEVYNKNSNKLDLYGKVVGLHYFSDNGKQDGDKTYVRLGVKGETQINDMLTGFGQWEYEFKGNRAESGNSSNSDKTRLAFAGLKFGEYGSIDYGRNYGILYDVGSYTDVLPEFGGDTYTNTDNFMTGRTSGVATYRNTDFFGLVEGWNFALQYQGQNGNGSESNNGRENLKEQNGDGWGISSSYDFGMGVSIVGAFASSDRTNDQTQKSTAQGEKAEAWTIGAKYDANNIYLATTYAQTYNMTPYGDSRLNIANKTDNFEVTAQYQFDFGLRPEISYLLSKGKDLGQVVNGKPANDKDLVEYISVGAKYYFNKNMSTYVDYKINLLDDKDAFYTNNGINTDDVVGVGMVYQF